jgi:hypothetical protein
VILGDGSSNLSSSTISEGINQVIQQKSFDILADVWQEDTDYLSNVTAICEHPIYRAIIRMGWDVVPNIINRMYRDHGHWFRALTEITGENPLVDEEAGDIAKMTQRWVDWWEERYMP